MSETLAVTVYRPKSKAKACVEIIHGMQEHRKRYDEFACYLRDNGYGVITFDLPGHGETAEGKMLGWFGKKNGWDMLLSCVQEMFLLAKKEFPYTPVFVLGHSMGSILARCWMQDHDEAAGIILSGPPNYNEWCVPGLAVAGAIKMVKGAKGHSKTLDKLVTGVFNDGIENPKTPIDWLSYNEETIRQYMGDPLTGVPFTIQGYIDEIGGLVRMHDVKRYRKVKKDLPIILLSGKDDPVPGGMEGLTDSIETLQKAGYGDVSCRIYEHMRHEILNSLSKYIVWQEIRDWMDSHLEV